MLVADFSNFIPIPPSGKQNEAEVILNFSYQAHEAELYFYRTEKKAANVYIQYIYMRGKYHQRVREGVYKFNVWFEKVGSFRAACGQCGGSSCCCWSISVVLCLFDSLLSVSSEFSDARRLNFWYLETWMLFGGDNRQVFTPLFDLFEAAVSRCCSEAGGSVESGFSPDVAQLGLNIWGSERWISAFWRSSKFVGRTNKILTEKNSSDSCRASDGSVTSEVDLCRTKFSSLNQLNLGFWMAQSRKSTNNNNNKLEWINKIKNGCNISVSVSVASRYHKNKEEYMNCRLK